MSLKLHMSPKLHYSSIQRIVVCFVATLAANFAFATRYWHGTQDSVLYSDAANWSESSGGSTGVSAPDSTTGDTNFRKSKSAADKTVFDNAYTVGANVYIDTNTPEDAPFIWTASDPAYGLTMTADGWKFGHYADKTPAWLQIDSGTYSAPYLRMGIVDNAKVGLIIKGGNVSANTIRMSENASVNATLRVDGGTLTSSSELAYKSVANSTNIIEVKSGTVSLAKFLLGGRASKTPYDVANSYSKLEVSGGTLQWTGESGIGYATGEGSFAEMIVNEGATVNCNYGYFYVGESGPGALTMNGGTFTMAQSDNGGLTFGRLKSGKDVGALYLNGGVLSIYKLRLDYIQPGTTATFNGGTLKALKGTTSFINESDNLTCVIKDGGLIVDTAGYDITIKHAFVDEDGTAASDSTKIGTITKKGTGTLTLSAAFPADKIIVKKGTVSANGTTYEPQNDTASQSRYWLGATEAALVSDTANWASASGGEGGASSIDDDYLGTVYFDGGYTYSKTVFDSAVELAKTVYVGSENDLPSPARLAWSASDASYGLNLQGNDMLLGYDSTRPNANLEIDSGTYSSGYMRVGYTANADVEVVQNGGVVTVANGRIGGSNDGVKGTLAISNGTFTATSSMMILPGTSGVAKTGGVGLLEVNGGTLVTTGPDFVRIGEMCNHATSTLHMVSGTWNTKSFLVGGNAKKAAGNYPGLEAYLVVDGGTVTASADSSIGANVGEGARSEMIVNNGTVTINANVLYVGDGGPGYLTMNGGSLKITNTSHGLSLGHAKSDGTGVDVGTVTLNGGTLEIPKFRLDYVAPGSKIVFNGGTLKATCTQTEFINATDSLTCEIQSGNLIIDTAGYDVTIAHDLTGAGGIIKRGEGTLHLTGNNTFTGAVTVEGGSVDGDAIAEDPSSYTTTLTVTEAGQDFGTVQLHRSPLSLWLANEDFETYDSKYSSHGTSSKETPRYIKVEANGETQTFMNLNTASNVTGTVGGLAYSFTTEDVAPRTLRLDYSSSGRIANVRDCGSWPLETLNEKKMNQDVILRGGNLDGFATAPSSYVTDGYLTKIGLKTEIDLRRPSLDSGMADAYKNLAADGTANSLAAENCAYYRFDLGWGTGDGTQIGADDSGNFTNQIRKVFSTWGTAGNLPSYFHCQIGTDRTGVTGLLLLGLMGVEEEVLYRDYLMSNFANIGGSRDSGVPETFIRYILRGDCNSGKYSYTSNDTTYGRSVASRVRQYLEMCGVTAEEIANITQALSGETPAEVLARVDAYETANNFRTVSYVPYAGSSTTNAIHRFGTNGRRILPRSTPTRSGYTFLGWDVDNETVYDQATGDSVVYALWQSDVAEPKAYKWNNNGGDNRLANGDNWYVSGSDPKEYGTPTIIDTCEVAVDDAHLVLTNGDSFAAAKFEFTNGSSTRYPVLDITNGTFTVDGNFNLGYWGHRGEANIFGGVVDIKNLIVGDYGSREYNKFNVYGGDVTVRSGFRIGTNIDARGDVSISGGTVTSLASIYLGDGNLSAVGGPGSGYRSTLSVSGGALSVTGNVYVANSDCSDAVYTVSDGDASISGDLNIAGGSNSWAQVDVLAGGSLTVGGTIRVGNHTYAQHAVLNIAGGTLDVKSLSVARQCDGYVYVTDGGTIYAESIDKAQGAPSSAHPYFYFDDANIAAKSSYEYTFASSSGITLGAGGLTFDTAGYNPKIQAFTSIDGIGGLTKKGEGMLELVANSFGFAGAYNAHGVITVEAGTLRMPSGQTFYVEGTNVAEGATLDLHGSELVFVTKKIEGSVWTNATGDRNAENPANWSTVVAYYGEDGKEIEAIRVSLDGVLPAATSDVRIPIDSEYPTNLDPATVMSVTYVSSRDMSLILDFAATYDNYAAPALALSGDVKVQNNFNGLLNSAVAWYDPSDVSTLKLNVDGTVNGLANKGSLGSALDLEPMGDTSSEITMPIIEGVEGWKLDGISFAATNRGFKTSYTSNLAGDKTLICVDQHGNDEWYPFLANGDGTYEWVGACEVFGSLFRYYAGNDWGEVLNMNGAPGTGGKNTIRSFRIASKSVKGEIYYAADDSTYSGSAYDVENLVSENMRLCMGERSWWNGSAKPGYVGESLAFDTALSDNATTAIRQYLASKWLDGDAVAPSAGTTVFDRLVLEGADVDMDGASVSVSVLGGHGSITNCTVLAVASGLSFGLDDSGNPEKTVVYGDLDISAANVMNLDQDLCQLVGTGAYPVIPLIEVVGNVTLGDKKRFKIAGRNYSVYVVSGGDRNLVVLAPGSGSFIIIR